MFNCAAGIAAVAALVWLGGAAVPRDQGGLRASVSTDRGEVAAGGVITFTLLVENGSSEAVTLEFRTSQRYEFLVTSAAQDTVWRWGEGRGFMQVLGQEELGPGKVLTYREQFEARLAPGRYVVTGLLVARNRLLQATAEFVVVEP
jgi:hypothetical protein